LLRTANIVLWNVSYVSANMSHNFLLEKRSFVENTSRWKQNAKLFSVKIVKLCFDQFEKGNICAGKFFCGYYFGTTVISKKRKKKEFKQVYVTTEVAFINFLSIFFLSIRSRGPLKRLNFRINQYWTIKSTGTLSHLVNFFNLTW
jgi:hypothetical protein